MLSLAIITAKDLLRQPAILLLSLFFGTMAISSPLYTMSVLLNTDKPIRDLALATLLLLGLCYCFFSIHSLRDDLENDRIDLLRANSVGPIKYFLGKHLGSLLAFCPVFIIVASLAAYTLDIGSPVKGAWELGWIYYPLILAPLIIGTTLSLSLSYFSRFPAIPVFIWTASGLYLIGVFILALLDENFASKFDFVLAMGLVFLGTALLISISLLLASALSFPVASVFVFVLSLLGVSSASMLSSFDLHPIVTQLLQICIPPFHLFWVADTLSEAGHISLHLFFNAFIVSIIWQLATCGIASTLCLDKYFRA